MATKRTAKDYVNENFIQGLEVLEALEGSDFEPVSIKRVVERVNQGKSPDEKLSYDKVRRLLLSAKLKRWAAQNDKGEWVAGSKFIYFLKQE